MEGGGGGRGRRESSRQRRLGGRGEEAWRRAEFVMCDGDEIEGSGEQNRREDRERNEGRGGGGQKEGRKVSFFVREEDDQHVPTSERKTYKELVVKVRGPGSCWRDEDESVLEGVESKMTGEGEGESVAFSAST